MLEAYFAPEPLEVEIDGNFIEFKNLNSFSIPELYGISLKLGTGNFFKPLLQAVVKTDEKNILENLSHYELSVIWMAIEDNSGFSLTMFSEIMKTIDLYEQPFQYDLGNHTNIKTISELFLLKPLDLINIVVGIINYGSRDSWTFTKIQDHALPYNSLHNIERLLYMVAVYTANIPGRKAEIKFPEPIKAKADKHNNEALVPLTEEEQKTMEERIAKWREKGSYT